jgi:NADH-quinone oxidoreductase subunit L
MTAFYMWRLCFLTFFGAPRNQHRYDHAHESPNVMTWPLVFLAGLSICSGWVALPWLEHGFSSFVYHGEAHHAEPEYLLMVVSTLVSVSGIGLAWLMYHRKAISADEIAARFKPVYTLLYNKYYFDELYDLIIVRPVMATARFLWTFDANIIDGAVNGTAWLTVLWSDAKQWFDVKIVDGAVNGSGWLVQQGAAGLRFVQSGAVQFYALCIGALIVVIGLHRFEMISDKGAWNGIVTVAFVLGLVVLGYVSRSLWRRQNPPPVVEPEEESVRVEDR